MVIITTLLHFFFFFFPASERGGKRRWTQAEPPVSCLLCIQQQLCVNAWAHSVYCCLTDSLSNLSCGLPQRWSGWSRCRRRGIPKLYPNPLFYPPQCLIHPNKAWVSFTASLPPCVSLRAGIVNGRNKLISVQSRLQLRGSLTHHGCKVLSDCWWEFYSRRTTKPGFCPLFGLLQLQQGEKIPLFVRCCAHWC